MKQYKHKKLRPRFLVVFYDL